MSNRAVRVNKLLALVIYFFLQICFQPVYCKKKNCHGIGHSVLNLENHSGFL